jgi:hypothetical protein
MAVAAPVLEQLTLALAGFVVFVAGMSAVAAHHETVPSHHIALDTKNPRVKSWGLSLRDSSARGVDIRAEAGPINAVQWPP